MKEDSGWAELLRSFGTQTSAGIKYGVLGIKRKIMISKRFLNSAKGKSLEREFGEWMKSDLGYSKTEFRVPVKGKVSERSYEVDIHGIKHSKLMNAIWIVGIALLLLSLYACITEDAYIKNVAARIIRVVNPDQAGDALGILGVIGFFLGLYGKSKTKVHAWVECKNQKPNVKRHQIQKVISSVEDVRALEEAKWQPKQVIFVSGTDFDSDALHFAREYGVTCYRRKMEVFELVSK